MTGAFIGPFFAVALPSNVIARLVAAMIVGVGVIVLATLRWGGLGEVRPSMTCPPLASRVSADWPASAPVSRAPAGDPSA